MIMKIEDFAEKLKKCGSILIFCHQRPDGDTLGCAFALKKAWESVGKRADIVCASSIPSKYDYIDAAKTVTDPVSITEKYDAHVAVDCSTENMIGDGYALFSSNKNTFNIDHHVSNTSYAKYNYVENTASCCELVYKLLSNCGIKADKTISDCLLLGISTDTGNFAHSNVTKDTLSVASELVANGGNLHDVAYRMFKSQPKARALLYTKILNGMRFFHDDKIAVISINKKDIEDCGATTDMTEGFIDFPLSIDGVEVAVSILENKPNAYKISLRSKGIVNVNEIATEFGGGGHVLASGCLICGFYEDVKDKIVRAVSLRL